MHPWWRDKKRVDRVTSCATPCGLLWTQVTPACLPLLAEVGGETAGACCWSIWSSGKARGAQVAWGEAPARIGSHWSSLVSTLVDFHLKGDQCSVLRVRVARVSSQKKCEKERVPETRGVANRKVDETHPEKMVCRCRNSRLAPGQLSPSLFGLQYWSCLGWSLTLWKVHPWEAFPLQPPSCEWGYINLPGHQK